MERTRWQSDSQNLGAGQQDPPVCVSQAGLLVTVLSLSRVVFRLTKMRSNRWFYLSLPSQFYIIYLSHTLFSLF